MHDMNFILFFWEGHVTPVTPPGSAPVTKCAIKKLSLLALSLDGILPLSRHIQN